MSWMLGTAEHHLLVDPVLTPSFGTTPALQFVIDPPRHIDVDAMPQVDAILLTTEHLQHFQPRTFRLLAERSRRPNVHVHRMFPTCASDILTRLGFEVVRHANGEEASAGPWRFAFFTNPKETHCWDSRVAAVVVRDHLHTVVVQSDTLPSRALAAHVRRSPTPLRCVIATYNALLAEQGSGAGLTNALPIRERAQRGAAGVRLLAGALVEPFRALPPTPHLLIAGSGYKDSRGVMQAPARTPQAIARIADELSLGTRVIAPLPGQRTCLESGEDWRDVPWIERVPTRAATTEALGEGAGRLAGIYADAPGGLNEHALRELARAIVGSGFGRELLRVGHYLGRWLGPERFVIQLVDGEGFDLVLDLCIVDFVRRPLSGDAALRTYPFGVRTTEADFAAVLRGHLQIWEFSMVAARQWYLCNRFVSPMAFFYSYFNEAIHQDLARVSFERDLLVP